MQVKSRKPDSAISVKGSKRASIAVRKMSTQSTYTITKAIGLAYGHSFQTLQRVHYSEDGIAHGIVQVYQWSTQSTAQYPQPHTIHPITLDALFQLMLVALSKGTEERLPTIMPTRISKLWIAGQGVSHPYIKAVQANAQATFSGRRKASGSMFVLDETTNELLVSLEMMEVTALTSKDNLTQSPESKGRLCYSLSWKPDVGLLRDRPLSEYCERTRTDRVSDAEFYEDLGFVLLKFMSDALDAVVGGNSLTPNSYLHKYIKWAKFQVERFHEGALPNLSNSSSKWILLSRDSGYRKELTEQLESTNQGRFFVSVGRHLPRILQGLLDPLSYMFQDDLVPAFYREINDKVICYEPLNQYLDMMCHKNPGIKVLELGAGTGATTAFILNALSSHKENGSRTLDCTLYDYTDISPAFFETAARDFQEHSSRMRFKILDIEADPCVQGFELETYDLIVSASVGLSDFWLTLSYIVLRLIALEIGASRYKEFRDNDVQCPCASQTVSLSSQNYLTGIKEILTNRRGGKIAIFEMTQDVLRAQFAFGLLPGWWLSKWRFHIPCLAIVRTPACCTLFEQSEARTCRQKMSVRTTEGVVEILTSSCRRGRLSTMGTWHLR